MTPKIKLKSRRGKWYARIRWSINGKRDEKQVPLRTCNESTAYIRLELVRERASSIALGNKYSFPWMNENGKTKIENVTLKNSINLYMKQRENSVRKSTLIRDRIAFDRMIEVLGANYPIDKLVKSDIDKFKTYYHGKHKPGGINFNLKIIRTYLTSLYEEKFIPEKIKVKLLDIGKPLPHYLTELELKKIMRLDWLDDFYKQAFYYYLTTGCRKSEPFLGKIDGNWLIVDFDKSKGKNVRQIHLNPKQLDILIKMKSALKQHIEKGMKEYTHIDRYNKVLKKALQYLDKADTRSLHDLRHTFAVMRYLETRDIYQVKTEMGHASVVMTEKYANFDIRKLEQDFPSLVSKNKTRIIKLGDTDSGDTLKLKRYFTLGK